MIICAIDPGSKDNVGIAFWGEDGPIDSFGGTSKSCVFEAASILSLCSNHECKWVIENVFVGKSAYSSLICAESRGFIKGLLSATRMASDWYWEPKATEWRKAMGFPTMAPKEDGSGTRRCKAKDHAIYARKLAEELTFKKFRAKDDEHEADAICMAKAGWDRWEKSKNGSAQQSFKLQSKYCRGGF